MERSTKILAGIIAGAIVLLGIYLIMSELNGKDNLVDFGDFTSGKIDSYKGGVASFDSYESLKAFLKRGTQNDLGGSGGVTRQNGVSVSEATGSFAPSAEKAMSSDAVAADYSTTNVQVSGVDEADIVKNDGKYIYSVSRNRVFIVEAYPADEMKILSEINFGEQDSYRYNQDYTSESIGNIYVNGDKLVVFSTSYHYIPYTSIRCLGNDYCGGNSEYFSNVYVYDIKDRANPRLEQNITSDGVYSNSRMIGDYVYTVSTKYANPDEPELPLYWINGAEKELSVKDIRYFDYPDQSYVFTSISAINLNNGEFSTKTYLTGYSSALYASENNLYLTGTEYMDYEEYQKQIVESAVLPLLPSGEKQKVEEVINFGSQSYNRWDKIGKIVENYYNSLDEADRVSFNRTLIESIDAAKTRLERERERTVIHKIEIKDGDIEYAGSGKAPGHILNQFSMDESEGYFRIATTTGQGWWWGWWGRNRNQSNNLYVLDSDMKVVGSIEDIANGERIYSVRFMGERAYMVTFRQIDPLFVIDLSRANEPRILGYLKIPGVSDYLHPYDENHIIGIGREANEQGRMKGVKVSLFDVSDVANPKESAQFIIGDRGTSSPVLYDHKALLFNKAKNLMVLPVLVYEINPLKPGFNPDWAYGEPVWQGAYVFNVTESSISLRGRITHFDGESGEGYWTFYDSRYQISRSLYMESVLYSISESKIKANDLGDLNEVGKVKIPAVQENNPVYPYAVE